MFCTECGLGLPEDAKFCGSCGTPASVQGGAVAVVQTGERLLPGGFWRRMAAHFIDTILVSAIVGTLVFGMSVGADDASKARELPVPWQALAYALSLVTWIIYYAFFEASRFQATPGKAFLRLVVISPRGGRIGGAQATARSAVKALSCVLCGFGFLMSAWTRGGRALHDVICETLVVRDTEGHLATRFRWSWGEAFVWLIMTFFAGAFTTRKFVE